jgi:hypothetical protein
MIVISCAGWCCFYQIVPGVVKSISEECLCDEVPHSVLVHRALTAGNLNKVLFCSQNLFSTRFVLIS